METAKIIKVAGPVVVAKGLKNAKMYDVVKVSSQKLIGEIIELSKDCLLYTSPSPRDRS